MSPAVGYPPSPAGADALASMRRFLEDVAVPKALEVEEAVPNAAFAMEPDGRLAHELHDLKRDLQQASAENGLYCPHLPKEDGSLGLGDCFYLQEAVYQHGLHGAQWTLAWTDGPSHLVCHWSDEAREAHLTDFIAGRTNVAFALTEPEAGSDFPALLTQARRDGADWVLSG